MPHVAEALARRPAPRRGPLALLLAAAMLASSSAVLAAQVQEDTEAPDRSGFTLLLSLGVGFQRDEFIGTTETGLGGLNLGIGAFLSEDAALMARVSGTNVDYGQFRQVSGVGTVALQYWASDKVNVEAGAGFGYWDVEGSRESGPGLMAGAAYSFFNNRRHSLQIGLEYALALTEPEMVHNVGIVFGWQLL